MARQARGKSMDPAKVQVFHTIQRCVRRAFLCGEDAVSGKSYDHRKQWIRAWERSGQGTKSGWLSPIEIAEANDPIGADMSQFSGHDARRASSKGFLNLTLEFYLELLDWTGRNLASGKRGAIPDHLEPILKRVGLVSSGWCDLIQQFGRLFKRAVGSPQALCSEAKARGQKYLHGTKTAAFASG